VASRTELLTHLWREVIDANLRVRSLEQMIAGAKLHPEAPFADTGPAIERLLALGASPDDICLVRRDAAYDAVFATLYALGDPGVDGNDVFMLHESLRTADPSGLEGRPGSARAD